MIHKILPLGRRDPAKLCDGLANEKLSKSSVIVNEWKNAEKEVRTRTTIHPGRLRAGAFHRAPQDMESTQNMTRMTKKVPLMKILCLPVPFWGPFVTEAAWLEEGMDKLEFNLGVHRRVRSGCGCHLLPSWLD